MLPTANLLRVLMTAVLLPGTGEHGFLHRRASIALPLARMGIATLVRSTDSVQLLSTRDANSNRHHGGQILEGPFYGRRRPSDQNGSKLRRCVYDPSSRHC